MAEQLSFPQPHTTSYAADDFHPGEASAEVRAMLAATESWPNLKLVLVGEGGAGKTHLAHVWAQDHGANIVASTELMTRSDVPLVVDDADQVAGDPDAEVALFHLHNNMATAGLPLLLTARTAPSAWGITLPDLRSRMEATTTVRIAEPDDATLGAILLKLMADRQLSPAPDLVGYLTARMGRSYSEVRRIVDALDALSLAEKRNITKRLAARVLDADAE